ncbi:MAG: RodZ domain-containing protein [Alphaproteobacteria bacterium]
MSLNNESVGKPYRLQGDGDSAGRIDEQNNQFPYYPELWAGQSLGTILREYRKSYGLDLHQVSDALKIRSVYLDYIETSAYENLPGYVYGQGFVRSYASYLGLPQNEMLALYKAESQSGKISQPDLAISAALSAEKTVPPIGVILGALLGFAILIYMGYFVYSRLSFEGEANGEPSVSIYERVSTFIFGSDDVPTNAPAVTDEDADLLSGAGPIVVGVDGTVSISPTQKPDLPANNGTQPNQTANQNAGNNNQATDPANASANANPGQSLEPALSAPSYFPDGKAPFPRSKPDLTRQSIQTAQVAPPTRNGGTRLISNIDPNVPVITPQAVSVGTPAFGQGVGFASANVSVSGQPNIVNSRPIVGPLVPIGQTLDVRSPFTDQAVNLVETPVVTQTAPAPTLNTAAQPTAQSIVEPTVQPETQPEAQPEAQPEIQPVVPATTLVNPSAVTAESRVFIKAIARTWIKIVSSDGNTIAEQLLATNSLFAVPNQNGLTLLTGSLRSLEFRVDGRAVKAPESISSGTDTIKIDAEALLNQR